MTGVSDARRLGTPVQHFHSPDFDIIQIPFHGLVVFSPSHNGFRL